jgi:hypothetical protein
MATHALYRYLVEPRKSRWCVLLVAKADNVEYFCEKCRPDLHGPLKKWIRSRGRNMYVKVFKLPQAGNGQTDL